MIATPAENAELRTRPPRVRSAVVFLRGKPDWKEAVESAAQHAGAPSVADFIDRAIFAYSRTIGFGPIPQR